MIISRGAQVNSRCIHVDWIWRPSVSRRHGEEALGLAGPAGSARTHGGSADGVRIFTSLVSVRWAPCRRL